MKIILKVKPCPVNTVKRQRAKKHKMELELKAKPLSINAAWKGRRFKTENYLTYEEEVGYLLLKYPKNKFKLEHKLSVSVKFYLCGHGLRFDVDNLIKPLLDILTKNEIIPDDRIIYKLKAEKIGVENKEEQRIEIKIKRIK